MNRYLRNRWVRIAAVFFLAAGIVQVRGQRR